MLGGLWLWSSTASAANGGPKRVVVRRPGANGGGEALPTPVLGALGMTRGVVYITGTSVTNVTAAGAALDLRDVSWAAKTQKWFDRAMGDEWIIPMDEEGNPLPGSELTVAVRGLGPDTTVWEIESYAGTDALARILDDAVAEAEAVKQGIA